MQIIYSLTRVLRDVHSISYWIRVSEVMCTYDMGEPEVRPTFGRAHGDVRSRRSHELQSCAT